MRQEADAKSVLFASVLNAHAHQAERRARLLRVVPLILALHILAIGVLAPDRRETDLPVRSEDDVPVLKLLAARPALPSAVAAAAAPAQALTRRGVARKVLPRLKPVPLPTRAPEAEESPPPSEDISEVDDAPPSPSDTSDDTSEAEGGTASTDVALDSVDGAVVGGMVGGLLSGVLPSGVAAPASLTPEEREEWVERYMETIIRDRFGRVRYPHLAAAAGITGQVTLLVSISSQGRLLKLELLGRCPHPVLCDAAQEAVRNAEPFPPPPPELGNPCLLELPFRYRLR
jgi:protein TonB